MSKKKVWLTVVLLVVIAWFLSGCAEPTAVDYVVSDKYDKVKYIALSSDTYRFIDYDADVVCYVARSGIDCLPLSETSLDE